ncbi:rhamnose ABC transporter substrate-binding protein [Solimonas sp. K1W22B-7]|nr:rhamnose ABC transporter substrate-binding protein [Solimonas sp. K1W22B-7]
MVVKSSGNKFFLAAYDGAKEAAKEMGNVNVTLTGPTTPTAEGQIEIINSLIAQKVSAIVISANDPDALVPIAKRAMQRGIKVVSFDSGIAEGGRAIQLNPSDSALVGTKLAALASDAAGGTGDIAVLSATAQATNQNLWIGELKKALATSQYSKLKLVATVYGDDQTDKSYREAIGLLRSHTNLKVIVAPTAVGITAAAKAVADEKKIGKVYVTGLGLPSELERHVANGSVKSFAIWNPVDLGYTATWMAYQLVTGNAKGNLGEKIPAGRMGGIMIGPRKEAVMSEPFTFDSGNIKKFATIF